MPDLQNLFVILVVYILVIQALGGMLWTAVIIWSITLDLLLFIFKFTGAFIGYTKDWGQYALEYWKDRDR